MSWKIQIVALAVLAPLVAGCSGDEDPKPKRPEPDAAGSDGLCRILDSDILDRLSGDYAPREDLMLGHENFIGCDVDGMSSFEFGVRAIDDGRPIEEYLLGEPERLEGLGDEAFTVESAGPPGAGESVIARRGDVVVYVRNELLQFGEERSTHDDTLAVAEKLLALPASEVEAIAPTSLSEACPTPEAVAKVVGDIALARGGITDDELGCSYLGTSGARLLINQIVSDHASDFVSGGGEIKVEGAQKAIQQGSGNSIDVMAQTSSTEVWSVGATPVGTDRDAPVDRGELIALVESLLP